MDFSEAYKYAGPSPSFSPDGRYIATGVDARCVIRDAETLVVVQIFSCQDKIEHLSWSPNNKHVLCALYHRALLQVWSIDEPSWTCKIDEGPAGISSALWAPTGSDVLVVADFCIRMSIWSLKNQKCSHKTGPKYSNKGIHYSPDGSLLAVAERSNLKDYVAIYEGDLAAEPQRFRVQTSDLEDLAWSPNGQAIAVWDTPLTYNLLVYTPAGELLAEFKAYEEAIGIRCVAWSPSSQFLAIGSYDQVTRVLNNVTWKPTAQFNHPEKVAEEGAVVFQETREDNVGCGDEDNDEDSPSGPPRRRYKVCELPVEIACTRLDADKPNPQLGVRIVAFSPSGTFLATVNDNMPAAVWIWDILQMGMACVLLHDRPVKCIIWDPLTDRLAICTGSKRIHFWTTDGASCVHTPLQSLNAHHLAWKSDASSAIVCDRDRFCIAYMAT